MASLRMSMLDKGEEEAVHEYSLRNLSENGVLVRSRSVLRLLDESGANVDYKTGIARFAESMVSEALLGSAAHSPESI